MGAGIAQLACLGGYETLLHDPDAEALERGIERLRADLGTGRRARPLDGSRGRGGDRARAPRPRARRPRRLRPGDRGGAGAARAQARAVRGAGGGLRARRRAGHQHLLALGDGDRGRRPRRPERDLRDAFLQSAAADAPGRGRRGRRDATTAALAAGDRGRRAHGPHSRCEPPTASAFSPTAARARSASRRCGCYGERIAEPDQIDRIVRIGGGYRMGPFELQDLIGIDVNLAVAKSFYEQSFGEPRWRPHPLQQRMVDSGRLGRKSGIAVVSATTTVRTAPTTRRRSSARTSSSATRDRGGRALGRATRPRAGAWWSRSRRLPKSRRTSWRRRSLLRRARQARRVHAGRRTRAGARADRLPARQRGLLRGRRGRRHRRADLDTALRLGFNHPHGSVRVAAGGRRRNASSPCSTPRRRARRGPLPGGAVPTAPGGRGSARLS